MHAAIPNAAIEQEIAVLRDELDACPATPAGYRAASVLRHRIDQLHHALKPGENECAS